METSIGMAELVSNVNSLREKQLNGGGLTDDEVKQGITYLIEIRRLRGAFNQEVPAVLLEKLEELF